MADRSEQWTINEAAKKLGVSVASMRRFEDAGITPPARRLARFRVYDTEELEQLRRILDERRQARRRPTRPLAA